VASAALYGAALIALASRALRREEPGAALPVFMVIGLAALIGGLVVDALALSRTDLRPRQTSYGAAVATLVAFQALFVASIIVMGLFTLAAGLPDG
jgi:hypothetical protein